MLKSLWGRPVLIYNIASLAAGIFPESLKRALLAPLLKKMGLDVENRVNFRPVSNLVFLGKTLEKVVSYQIRAHCTKNGLYDELQSAYKEGTSTETALIRIKADIDMMLNEGDSVLLVLLDLSAAFDTVDHDILMTRLEEEVGLQGTALKWIRSYLTGRTQAVHINSSKSNEVSLSVGVPQGSVLGPLLFLIYLLPLRRIISAYNILRHGFADDAQLYNRLTLSDPSKSKLQVANMQNCLAKVRSWMRANQLKLNDSKTEVMVVTKKTQLALAKKITITIGESTISPTPVAGNLGAKLDQLMSMEPQINAVTRKMYYNIRRISKVKHHLTSETCAKVINATVTSHLDYHNGLLLGLPSSALRKLQVAQNNAARLLTGAKYRDHIKPVLYHLHWLPVRQRITFKVMVTIHKTLHAPTAPSYLKELISLYQPRRTLRSASDPWKLQVPRSLNKYGDRSLQVLGAKLWNDLPAELRAPMSQATFKKQLKTVLFREAFD